MVVCSGETVGLYHECDSTAWPIKRVSRCSVAQSFESHLNASDRCEAVVVVLARVAAEDSAWNVRYSALDTLAVYGAKTAVIDALRRADSDPDERVRDRAAEALVALRLR